MVPSELRTAVAANPSGRAKKLSHPGGRAKMFSGISLGISVGAASPPIGAPIPEAPPNPTPSKQNTESVARTRMAPDRICHCPTSLPPAHGSNGCGGGGVGAVVAVVVPVVSVGSACAPAGPPIAMSGAITPTATATNARTTPPHDLVIPLALHPGADRSQSRWSTVAPPEDWRRSACFIAHAAGA